MSDYNASRLGQVNGAGDTDALFLKVFPGEVLNWFNTANKIMPLHMVKNISSGKSAQFPATGNAVANYHVPGTQITGQTILANEKIIYIDDLLVADAFVAKIDEAMNHYETRGEYSKQLGEALALTADQNCLIVGVLAARTAATITGGDAGTAVTDTNAKTSGAELSALMFDAAQALDEHNVSDSDRFAAMLPAQYYLLAQTTNVINKDWGGSGSYAKGTVLEVAGISFVKTNNLPSANISSSPTGTNNTYHGDFSKTAGLVWNRSAMGTVKLMDVVTEKEYSVARKGTLMTADYAIGHGVLRPECAVELANS
jgi:hypothetical protein